MITAHKMKKSLMENFIFCAVDIDNSDKNNNSNNDKNDNNNNNKH